MFPHRRFSSFRGTTTIADSTHLPAHRQLKRALGPGIATAVVVGSVIGSGIFLKPGTIAAVSGDFPLIISAWISGGVLCMLGGLCLAELAAMLPHAGGPYVYLREAYGRWVAFLFGWTVVVFLYPASVGALAVAFIGALNKALNWDPTPAVEVVLSAALIAVVAWVNILGVVWGGRFQMGFTLIKAGFLLLIALLPFALAAWVGPSIQWSNYSSTIPARQPELARQFGAVLLSVMWAYNGWEAVTPLAEEIRRPQRNMPLALIAGIGILMALYVAVNVAYHGVLSMAEMAAAGDHAAEEVLNRLLGRIGLAAMSMVIMCSTLGAINTTLLYAPRITFAMARDGAFFRYLGTVHANFRTPVAAIAVMAIMAILLVAVVAAGKSLVGGAGQQVPSVETPSAAEEIDEEEIDESRATPSPTSASPTSAAPKSSGAEERADGLSARIVDSLRNGSTFDLLTNFVIFSVSIFYALAVAAVIVLRFRMPDRDRPYRAWGYPLTPLVFAVVYAWFLTEVYQTNPLEARAGLLIIAAGLPVYLVYRASRRRDQDADRPMRADSH